MKQFDSTIGLMVWEEEECKDSTCPSSLLESRRTWILDGPGDGVKEEGTSIISACESFIKIWHQEPCQDSTCPSSIFLESRRTWTFLMDLEMVSDEKEHPSEVSVKVSSRSDIRNHVKTPPVLQVSSWGLGGHGGSWCTWWWSQIKKNILEKLPWKFHEDWTSESL